MQHCGELAELCSFANFHKNIGHLDELSLHEGAFEDEPLNDSNRGVSPPAHDV